MDCNDWLIDWLIGWRIVDPPAEDPSYIEKKERNFIVALSFLSKLGIKGSRPASSKSILSPSLTRDNIPGTNKKAASSLSAELSTI